ncbi:efflux transporter outer membrane subunit [Methylosoma difficile]
MVRVISKIITSVVFSVAGSLLACSTQITPIANPVVVPAHFSASGTVVVAEKWWQAFHDDALNHLCEQALAHNFSLLAAFNRLEQARAIAKKSGSGLVPQLSASQSDSQTLTEPSGNNASIGWVASYELDLWGRIRSARNAAALDAQASQQDVTSAAIAITASISSTWFQIIEQRQQLALLDRQIQVNDNNVKSLAARFAGGQATAADVFQQKQLLESVKGSRLTVVANLKVLENQLAVLLGVAPGTIEFAEALQFPALPALPATGLSADLMQRRPDVRKATLQVQAADQRIASAIAERLPKLSLSAGVSTNGTDLQPLFNNWLGTIAGNLLTPLVDGGFRVAEVQRNEAVAAEAMNLYANTLLTAVQEVENALVQERQQQLLVVNLGKQVEFAKLASERINMRYVNGASDYLRWLSALLSQQSLERSLITAERQLLDYRIALYRALSGGFPINQNPA